MTDIMGVLRSALSPPSVDYLAIADMFATANLSQDMLIDTVAPYLWTYFESVGFKSYEILALDYYEGRMQGASLKPYPSRDPVQTMALHFTDLLLNGFAAVCTDYLVLDVPSNAILDPSKFYRIHANYDSGDSFNDYPNQDQCFAIVQGDAQMRRYMDMIQKRDQNRMLRVTEDDPEYAVKKLLGMHYMMPWEGYFERLNYFHIEIIWEIL